MSWAMEIAKLRREVVANAETAISRLFGWTLTSTSSPMGDSDTVETGDEPDSSGKIGQRPVRRIEPWGVRTRPPAKVRSLWLRLGSSNVVFLGIAPTKAYGPDGLEEGEVALYCTQGGTEIRLDKDGNVVITPAAGKTVQLAGTAQKLPLWSDFKTDFTVFVSQVDTFLKAVVPVTGIAAAAKLVYTTYAGLPASLVIKIATPTNYQSEKVTNE